MSVKLIFCLKLENKRKNNLYRIKFLLTITVISTKDIRSINKLKDLNINEMIININAKLEKRDANQEF